MAKKFGNNMYKAQNVIMGRLRRPVAFISTRKHESGRILPPVQIVLKPVSRKNL